jgi:hypothetical protein
VLLAGVCFQIGWSLVHLRARNAWSATVGMLAAAVVLAVFVISHGLAGAGAEGRASGLSDVFAVAYEIALILALVPQVAPSLAARLAAREMRVQRATVLSGFCIAVTVLFASLALVG